MYLKSRRNQGAGGDRPPQTLADLLTLSQSGGRGVYYAYHITNPPPRIFMPSYDPDLCTY